MRRSRHGSDRAGPSPKGARRVTGVPTDTAGSGAASRDTPVLRLPTGAREPTGPQSALTGRPLPTHDDVASGLFHDAVVASADAVIITDQSGRIEWVNPAFTRTSGYAAEQAIGQTPRLLRSGVMKPAFYEEMWSTIGSGREWHGEVVNRRLDGSLYSVEMTIAPIRRDDRITHFVAVQRDVSERRRTEADLRESETRYRELFEQSLDSIIITDPSLRIIDVNPATERMLGWSRSELLALDASALAATGGMRERFFAILRERGVVRDFEVSMRARSGTTVDVQLNAVPRWDERGRLLGYYAIARDITARKRFEDELQHLAFHDQLTGLPNLALFRDRLEHAVAQADRTATRLGLVYVDLDHFKTLNDSRGHNAGDRALQQVARRFLACTRAEDTVARIGGDEFAIIADRLTGPAQLEHILERLMATLRAPVLVDGHRLDLGASMGATIYEGSPASEPVSATAEALVRRADAAMYLAKRRQGTRFHIFDPAVDVDGSARLRRQQELRDAIETEQLSARYQPVIDLGTGELWGVEVLARWQHPERGVVAPAEFIPLAEESGLIGMLGVWILDHACGDLASWVRAGCADGLRLLVNLSARQLEDRELPERLAGLLEKHGIEPTRLHLEVTETVAVQQPGRVQALRAIGASVSVDDFGTGYSSLRYLRDLDVDSLKIDMGFVQGLDEDARLAAIVRTIITLGAELGLDVIAEGIESRTQLDRLRQMGCPLGQGYYFSRPVEAAQFVSDLAGRATWLDDDSAGGVAPADSAA